MLEPDFPFFRVRDDDAVLAEFALAASCAGSSSLGFSGEDTCSGIFELLNLDRFEMELLGESAELAGCEDFSNLLASLEGALRLPKRGTLVGSLEDRVEPPELRRTF